MVRGIWLRAALAAGMTVLGTSSAVFAHAHLETAEPPVDGVTAEAPAQVRIRFTERLEPGLSELRVEKASGGRVDKGAAKVTAGDPQEISTELEADLPAGAYVVFWTAASVDGHRTEGRYDFVVRP